MCYVGRLSVGGFCHTSRYILFEKIVSTYSSGLDEALSSLSNQQAVLALDVGRVLLLNIFLSSVSVQHSDSQSKTRPATTDLKITLYAIHGQNYRFAGRKGKRNQHFWDLQKMKDVATKPMFFHRVCYGIGEKSSQTLVQGSTQMDILTTRNCDQLDYPTILGCLTLLCGN